jgi:hypothetical protein
MPKSPMNPIDKRDTNFLQRHNRIYHKNNTKVPHSRGRSIDYNKIECFEQTTFQDQVKEFAKKWGIPIVVATGLLAAAMYAVFQILPDDDDDGDGGNGGLEDITDFEDIPGFDDFNQTIHNYFNNTNINISNLQNIYSVLTQNNTVDAFLSDFGNFSYLLENVPSSTEINRTNSRAKSIKGEYFIQTDNINTDINNLYKISDDAEKYNASLSENNTIIEIIKAKADQVGEDNLTNEEYDALKQAYSNLEYLLEEEEVDAYATILRKLYKQQHGLVKNGISDRNGTLDDIQEIRDEESKYKEEFEIANATGGAEVEEIREKYGSRVFNYLNNSVNKFNKSLRRAGRNLTQLNKTLDFEEVPISYETVDIKDTKRTLKDTINNSRANMDAVGQILDEEVYTYVIEDQNGIDEFAQKYRALSNIDWFWNEENFEQNIDNVTKVEFKTPENPDQLHRFTAYFNGNPKEYKYDPKKRQDDEVNKLFKYFTEK